MENNDEGCIIKDIYLGFKFAFSYFSILPIKFKTTDDLSQPNILRFMILFFPLVGLVISSITVLIYTTLDPSWYTALICSVLYMLLYGFLHTEAVADVADALYATHSGKDAYKVIKDPTIGAMGLLYTSSFLILKVASLTFILLNNLFLEFIAIAMISRLSIVFLISLNDFKSSFVNTLKNSFNNISLIITNIIYISIIIYLIDIKAISLILSTIIISFIFVSYLKNKLKFLNGDILGANLELNELIMLIILALYYI